MVPVPETPQPIIGHGGLLSEEVFDRLGRAIIDGALQPGENLRDADIAKWLGVSRTPVREALKRLAQLGLVEAEPSRYTRVTEVDEALVRQTLEYTGYQAGLALRLAVPRMADDDVETACEMLDAMIKASNASDAAALYATSHAFVAFATQRTGNPVFVAIMQETGLMVERNLRAVRPMLGEAQSRSEWYRTMQCAIRERDADYAEFCFRKQHEL
jgi:DNA-binding GntR family transcriptional regulator